MRLKVLGSSSTGNCYLLIADNGETLIIEAGIKIADVKKALNFDIYKVSGCLISHCHMDHFKYAFDYAYAGIKCFSNKGTFDADDQTHYNFIRIEPKVKTKIGSFSVVAFDVVHDVECYAYLIDHAESGNIVFITDTHYCAYTFPKIHNWMIEANYDQKIMDENILNGTLPSVVRKRTGEAHMSIETCKKTLLANDLSETNKIILIHLSNGNSNAVDFIKQVQDVTGKPTMIAETGMEIEFNKTNF